MIQTDPLRDRFLNNLEAQIKSGSTYWLVLGGALLTLVASWPGLKDALDAIPILHGYGLPLSLMIGALVQKLIPSNVQTSQSQAVLVELARMKMNEWLRAKGVQEIEPDPTVTSKLPSLPVLAPTSSAPSAEPGVKLPEPRSIPAMPPVKPPSPAPAPVSPLADDPLVKALGLLGEHAEALSQALTALRASRGVDVAT